MKEFKDKIKNLPQCPGVYLMKDINGNIIYVGKSRSLKNRVSQYFQSAKNHSQKTVAMVSNIDDFEYIVTDTEEEALALECNLIKKYTPKYNILLKDDKQYPYIKITTNEDFPRIFITRKVLKDKAEYFGPYVNSYSIKSAVDTIKKVFMVRSCNLKLPEDIGKKRPCLYYYLKQCSAPCSGKINKDEYRETFSKISDVLKGNLKEINKTLKENMDDAAENLNFEKAAVIRDKISALNELSKEQKITKTSSENKDVIGIYSENNEFCVQLFYIRAGKVVGSEYFTFKNDYESENDVVYGFVKQFYFTQTNIPKEIILPFLYDDIEIIEDWISNICGHTVKFIAPKRGEKLSLLKMVNKNAKESFKREKFIKNKDLTYQNNILKECMEFFNLHSVPHRIECYDISNISGLYSVGGQVVYVNALPLKKAYRIYNIKNLNTPNDYESMKQVIFRRFNEFYNETDKLKEGLISTDKLKFSPLPDLILLDGGIGHVTAVKDVLDGLGEEIPVFGLIKDDKHKTSAVTDGKSIFNLDKRTEIYSFLFNIQEEVHRFAITKYRKKHTKSTIESELEKIKGIGPKKRAALLTYFKSINKIKSASLEKLELVVDKNTAQSIFTYFNGNNYEK